MKTFLSTTLALAFALSLSGPLAFAVNMNDLPNPAGTATEMKGKAMGQLLDINKASEDQLKKLPGIGDQYANKIVSGRPFSNVEELKSKGILPPAVYDRIKGFVTVQ